MLAVLSTCYDDPACFVIERVGIRIVALGSGTASTSTADLLVSLCNRDAFNGSLEVGA